MLVERKKEKNENNNKTLSREYLVFHKIIDRCDLGKLMEEKKIRMKRMTGLLFANIQFFMEFLIDETQYQVTTF